MRPVWLPSAFRPIADLEEPCGHELCEQCLKRANPMGRICRAYAFSSIDLAGEIRPGWKVEHVSASLHAVSSLLMGLGPLCHGRYCISSVAFGSADWLVSSAARPHRPVRVSERRARAPWLRRSAHPDMPAREDGCAEQIGLGFAASNADVHVYVRTRLQKASIG